MRRLRKILFFLLFLVLLTVAAIFYLNTIFLPLQVKELIIQKAKAALHRDVFIERLFFNPAKGIVFQNIRISQNNGDPVPLLTIQEAAVSVPLPDIFWTGRLYIPAIAIKNPVIDLKYSPDGQWNFSDLLNARKNTPATPVKTAKKARFAVGTVSILDGQATITDPNISETINAINTTLQIDLLRNVNFELSFLIPRHSSVVNANGHFVVADKELTASIKAKNADIPPLLSLSKIPLWVDFRECFLKKTDLKLRFQQGELTLEGAVTGSVDLTTTQTATRYDVKTDLTSDNFFFKRKGPQFTLKGSGLAANTILTVGQSKVFTGTFKGTNVLIDRDRSQIDITGNITGDNTKMTFNGQTLTGDADIENVNFQRRGKDYTITAHGKMANIAIKNPALDFSAESGMAAIDLKRENSEYKLKILKFSALGAHCMYANKAINGDVRGENILISGTPEALQTDGEFKTANLRMVIAKSITLLGSPTVNLTVTKLTAEETAFSYTGTMTLNNDTLQGVPKFTELSDLKGTITFNNDLAETEELQATIKGSPWTLTGKVKNFKEASVSITAKSGEMNLEIVKDLFAKKLKNINADITGIAQNVVVKYEGLVFAKDREKDRDATEMTASGTLKSAEVTAESLPQKVTNINGYVEYAADALDWKELNFSYAGKGYTATGSLRDFSKPAFNSTLSGDNFAFSVEGRTNDRIVTLRSWKGHYRHAPFDLTGSINFRGDVPMVSLNGSLIDGKASLDSKMSLNKAQASDVVFEVIDLNLEKLKDSVPTLEKKNISGNLSMNTKFSGPLLAPGLWEGTGALSIKDGHILEIDLLKGIWKTLFSNLLVDDYKHIAFSQAMGNFKIESGKVSTKDLLLKSPSVDLSMSGWIGLNGTIDFNVIADVRQAPIVTSNAVKAVPTTIVSQFAKNVVGFKVTGSLREPQIKYKILPLKVLKKTTDSVFLGIQGMMEDLLQ